MNVFLKDQFPALTDAQLAQIDAYYPKTVEQFPGTGAYWWATANAYDNMRYSTYSPRRLFLPHIVFRSLKIRVAPAARRVTPE